MAFDGFTIAALVSEMDAKLTGGHIQKIAQPEADELLLSKKIIKHSINCRFQRVLLSR